MALTLFLDQSGRQQKGEVRWQKQALLSLQRQVGPSQAPKNAEMPGPAAAVCTAAAVLGRAGLLPALWDERPRSAAAVWVAEAAPRRAGLPPAPSSESWEPGSAGLAWVLQWHQGSARPTWKGCGFHLSVAPPGSMKYAALAMPPSCSQCVGSRHSRGPMASNTTILGNKNAIS